MSINGTPSKPARDSLSSTLTGYWPNRSNDLAIIMREDPIELLRDGPRARAAWLAARTGLDIDAIGEWGVVERTSTGLLAASIGLQPVGDEMLHAAEVIAATEWSWRYAGTLSGSSGPGIGSTGAGGRVSGVSGDSSPGSSGAGSVGSIGG